MKILMIAPHVPAPRAVQAGEREVFEIIKILAEHHEVHLVVRVPVGMEDTLGPVRAICSFVTPVQYKRPIRRTILTIPRVAYSYYTLCREANKLSRSGTFDLLQSEWTETGIFLRKRGRMFIDAHDILTKPMERRYRNSRGLRRIVFGLLYRGVKLAEPLIFRRYDVVFVRSEYDRQYLLSLSPNLNVVVLTHPAGMDFTDRTFVREDKTLLFLAAMDRGPNVEAALYFWNDILPLIRKHIPDVKFRIVGSRPLPEVRALVDRDQNTVVTGFVEDIEPSYKTSTVFVAPLLTGGGIIVKILDALASGTPVVTTSIGNEGIGATPNEHLLIADTSEEFAEKVVRLLHDGHLRERIGEAGRAFVSATYGKDALRKSLVKWYPVNSVEWVKVSL